MTDTASAAASGSPSTFDRRSFIATLAAAGVMTAGAALPALPTDHPDMKLLELVAQYALHEARRHEFDRIADEAIDRLVPPPIPEVLLWRKSDFLSVCADRSRLAVYKIDGQERYVYDDRQSISGLAESAALYKSNPEGFPGRERTIARSEELIAAMDAREADLKRAEDLAGYTEPAEAADRETKIIAGLLREIALTPATTSEGLTAKGRIAAALHGGASSLAARLPKIVDSVDWDWREAIAFSIVLDANGFCSVTPPSKERSAA